MARIRSLGYGMAALALVAGGAVRAEDAAEAKATGPTISGFIDGTYSYDLRNPAGRMTAYRSYDATANTFRLDTAHVAIGGGLGDVNYVIETDFGTDAAVSHSAGLPGTGSFTDTPTGDTVEVPFDTAKQGIFDLQEAYVTFKDPIAKKLGLDILVKAGKFVTAEGIEVIESGSNPTTSRGYLFGLAEPFTHTGVLMTWSKGPIAISGGVVNGMDQIQDLNAPKMGLGVIALTTDAATMNFSGCTGAEQTGPGSPGLKMNSVDVTSNVKLIPKVDFWWQINYRDEEQATGGSNKMGGAGIQPVVHLTDALALGIRLEYFEAKNYGAPVGVLKNETATLSWSFAKNMTVRWEVRHDDANMQVFEDSFGNYRYSTATIGTEFITTF